MPSDYQAIRRDNEQRYGTDIGRIGHMLLADRYDDRTHFIFELLQNAEDALARRNGWEGLRKVSFHLTHTNLRFEHFGKPFDDADVRAICGIAESTKGLTEIGRFGIGFKSVYAITKRPEIHSGTDDFAIENFVWPVATDAVERDPDATVIILPFTAPEEIREDLTRALTELGPPTLLFLRQIEEIAWSIEGGRSGLFLRESKGLAEHVRRINIIGQEQGKDVITEEWLVFSRPVFTTEDLPAGYVELAFLLMQDDDRKKERIARVEYSPLVVYFPTVVETHLGFLVQGPYRTTPSRDNVPRADNWNRHLVAETATLLRETLLWLRDHDFLDTAALRCLPLDRTKFGETNMFAPLYTATKEALSNEALLPRFDAGHVQASRARLGRTQELRDLFTPTQLGSLYGEKGELVWLSSDITQDRTPELRQYLMQELCVQELAPEQVLGRLTKQFLEAQSDDWIVRLYELLNGQPALLRRLWDPPLVRLEDGTHVSPCRNGQPQVFLPGPIASGFPLVRAAICKSETAVEFLRSLGLTQPDPVDDVIRNILPKYSEFKNAVTDQEYADDIRRILHAFKTDSKTQREKLLATLRETAFVKTVDAANVSGRMSKPADAYLATELLKALFDGVEGVLFVDETYSCLQGEPIRELLEACGTSRSLCPFHVDCHLSCEELKAIRRSAGLERSTWEGPIEDVKLRGVDELLDLLPRLDPSEQRRRAELLWDALGELENCRGCRVFYVEYTWSCRNEIKKAEFEAAFVDQLNSSEWIPDAKGALRCPGEVVFDTLGWKPNPFLQSKIRFKPPVVEQLAKEVGIEPGVLDLLKKRGITSEAQLLKLLGDEEKTKPAVEECPSDVDNALKSLGIAEKPTPAVPESPSVNSQQVGENSVGMGPPLGTGTVVEGQPSNDGGHAEHRDTQSQGNAVTAHEDKCETCGSHPFISYVAVHANEEETHPDSLEYAAHMALEEKAIVLILLREPDWQRAPEHNPGFDLFEAGSDGQPSRWCEVKAMTDTLHDRPVGLSRAQFEWAQRHGKAYWLYIVERAGTDQARIVRIQDPAGKACTFTFDHGWLAIAEIDEESEEQED